MNLLEGVAKTIDSSKFSWIDIAYQIGIDVNDISKIKKKNNNTLEFVKTLTNKIWEYILSYVNILSNIEKKYVEIANVCTLGKILAGDIVREDSDASEIDVVKEIACRICEWKLFGRILNLKEVELRQIEENHQMIENRNIEIMEKFSEPSKPSTSWSFWREYLSQFDDGKAVISEIEMTFFDFLNQESSTEAHGFNRDNLTYIGHLFCWKNSNKLDQIKKNKRITVPVGSSEYQFVEYQQLTDWAQTQKRYIDTYNMLKDLKIINFIDSVDHSCPTLKILNKHFETVDRNGFAVKGYHFIRHVSLFKSGLFSRNIFDDHYFCIFPTDNILLYITKDTLGFTHALQQSTQNIEAANLLHKELQACKFAQINVITYSESPSIEYCKVCFDNQFYVDEKIFASYDKFLLWYNKVKKKVQDNSTKTEDSIFENIKKDMITYEALESCALPSFSNCSDYQMDELKKLVLMTPTQYQVMHSKDKHILLRGSYGSGKSLILLKKFENIINQIDEADVVYLLCNDPYSKYYLFMEQYKETFTSLNLIVGSSDSLLQLCHKVVPKLSLILNHILSIWKEKTVHIFIDEFDGSYMTKHEISLLETLLEHFKNSYIVISVQSMEESILEDKSTKVDIGYQFALLKEQTSFSCFDLEFSLRCSVEISKFIKYTSELFESTTVSVSHVGSYGYYGKIVDKEYGRESESDTKRKIKLKYTYNQTGIFGHNVSVSPVKVYCVHTSRAYPVTTLIGASLSFILDDLSETNGYVICYFENGQRDVTYSYLETLFLNRCTENFKDFTRPDSIYQILITDYSSVRGYEFANLIVLLPMDKKYLKYRNIECFSRATANLHVVIGHSVQQTQPTQKSSLWNKLFSKKQIDDNDIEIIQKWRTLECVNFFDCRYDAENDVLQMWYGESILKTIENASKSFTYSSFMNLIPKHVMKVEEDKDESIPYDLESGLHYIIEADNVDLISEFVNASRVDVNKFCDSYSNNLLHIAIKLNAIGVVCWLFQNFNINVNSLNYNGETPIYLAVHHQNVEIVKIMISKGADINLKYKANDTLLHIAIRRGNLDIVDFLINNGVDTNALNDTGSTPLNEALLYGHANIAKLLINNKSLFDVRNHLIIQAFFNAVHKSDVDVIKFLISEGIDVNTKDESNRTPLHIASVQNKIEIVKILIDNGANFQNDFSALPLHDALQIGDNNIAQVLIENGADVNLKNSDGKTPLYISVMQGNCHLAEILIENGADVNLRVDPYETPLNEALYRGYLNIAELFIKNGADVNIKFNRGATPLELAEYRQYTDIAEMINDREHDSMI